MISTHVLDNATGTPVAAVPIKLWVYDTTVHANWRLVAQSVTNTDGRVKTWHTADPDADEVIQPDLMSGQYRLHFDLQRYYLDKTLPVFYPYVDIVFILHDAAQHYHIPLLLSPYGYSTYRGS